MFDWPAFHQLLQDAACAAVIVFIAWRVIRD